MLTATGLAVELPNGRQLFRDLDLRVGLGQAVAIEGPSGVGKSTLLGVLGGLLTPTSGHVVYDPTPSGPGRGDTNADVHDPDPAPPDGAGYVRSVVRSPFAWVLQTLNSLGARTVTANACLDNVLDGVDRAVEQRRARAALAAVGLASFAGARARSLSGGELQRLAVARAMASVRPVVLADEPTSQLDRTNAVSVMRCLTGLAGQGRCVIIVTHDHDALPDDCHVMHLTESGLDAGHG